MSRNLIFSFNEYYHIYNRGVERRIIFLDDSDKERFVRLLYSANSSKPVHLSNIKDISLKDIDRGDQIVSIGAWCLMSNHFHLLIKEIQEDGISKFMQKLLTGYTMYFNKKYNRKGVLFEGVFSSKHLDTDNYLKYQYAYIHLNPISFIDKGWKNKNILDKIKAKKFLKEYRYSSFIDYSMDSQREECLILDKKVFPGYFSTFIDFNEMIDEWVSFDLF